jgi:hypothetical protein
MSKIFENIDDIEEADLPGKYGLYSAVLTSEELLALAQHKYLALNVADEYTLVVSCGK